MLNISDIDECAAMEYDDVASSALSDDEEYDEGYNYKNCHQEAKCINSFGSFKCECKEGFEGDGFECKSRLLSSFMFKVSEPG